MTRSKMMMSVAGVACAALLGGCQDTSGEIEVHATCTIPAGAPVPSATMLLTLYEHVPAVADQAARLMSRVEVRGLVLREGSPVEVSVPLRGVRGEQTAYYVVCDAFADGRINDDARLFFTDGVVPVLEGRDSDRAAIQLKPVPPSAAAAAAAE